RSGNLIRERRDQWPTDRGLDELAARHLLHVMRHRGGPRDPVARFHLGDGARLEAVHANAETSERGVRQSGRAMVNCLYDLTELSRNHASLTEDGVIAASPAALALAGPVETPRSQPEIA
ncbi:MAG: malonyl-CoA decarboxylase family protein, partial [Pseudomonadota bacterium]